MYRENVGWNVFTKKPVYLCMCGCNRPKTQNQMLVKVNLVFFFLFGKIAGVWFSTTDGLVFSQNEIIYLEECQIDKYVFRKYERGKTVSGSIRKRRHKLVKMYFELILRKGLCILHELVACAGTYSRIFGIEYTHSY